jgi:type IV pilus assembly protein PilE
VITSYPADVAMRPLLAKWRKGGKGRGFTLIELVIVVAIVAILAAIALPSYQQQMRKARRSQAKADLTELAQQLERSYTLNRSYAATSFNLANSGITQSPRDGNPFVAYTMQIAQAAAIYTLTAAAAGDQVHDRCGDLTLDNAGRKTHGGSGTDAECDWGTAP